MNRMLSQTTYSKMQLLPTFQTVEIVHTDKIAYIKAYESCTKVYLLDGSNLLCNITFGQLLESLSPQDFYQCHKSYAVNLKHLHRYHRSGDIEIKGEVKIPLARRRKDEFLYILNEFFSNVA